MASATLRYARDCQSRGQVKGGFVIMRAIETRYKGYRFRSRLEARWAVYFDALGVEWEYEPEGFVLDDGTLYLPDFYIKSWDCYAEVKPKQFTEREFEKCRQLNKHCLLLDTPHPMTSHMYRWTFPSRIYKINEWELGILLTESAHKGRLWFDYLDIDVDRVYWIDNSAEIAAKSARFEHGETPGG